MIAYTRRGRGRAKSAQAVRDVAWRWKWVRPTACARRVCCRLRDGAMRGCIRGWPTHRDEREGAARVDRDAGWVTEHGTAAGAVAEASRAVAGERGGLPGGDFDTADAVAIVLRCIMGGHAEEELNRRSGRAVCGGNRCTPTPCARRVCCRLRDGATRGCTGVADAPRRAPFHSPAMHASWKDTLRKS